MQDLLNIIVLPEILRITHNTHTHTDTHIHIIYTYFEIELDFLLHRLFSWLESSAKRYYSTFDGIGYMRSHTVCSDLHTYGLHKTRK